MRLAEESQADEISTSKDITMQNKYIKIRNRKFNRTSKILSPQF